MTTTAGTDPLTVITATKVALEGGCPLALAASVVEIEEGTEEIGTGTTTGQTTSATTVLCATPLLAAGVVTATTGTKNFVLVYVLWRTWSESSNHRTGCCSDLCTPRKKICDNPAVVLRCLVTETTETVLEITETGEAHLNVCREGLPVVNRLTKKGREAMTLPVVKEM